MTEKANPSVNRPAEAYKTAGAIAYGGHGGDGFVVDGANPTDISVQDSGITEGNLNTFAETSSGSSFDVDIDPGEAFVFGSWLAIDTTTTVTLASSTANQTVYVGWNKNGADDVIVGLAADFSDASGDTDERIPLWTFDTDGSGVTSVTDDRTIGYSIAVEGEATFGANADVTVTYDSANDELDVDGADLTVAGVTVVDESQGYIPQASFENDDVTVSAGTAMAGGGAVTLGNSVTLNHGDTSSQGDVSAAAGAAITDITLNPQGHVTGISTTGFDGRYVLESGDTINGDLTVTGSVTSNQRFIYDNSSTGGGVEINDNSSRVYLAPYDGSGSALYGKELSFDPTISPSRWIAEGGLKVTSSGTTAFGLPEVSSDPSSAQVADMWYRSDLD